MFMAQVRRSSFGSFVHDRKEEVKQTLATNAPATETSKDLVSVTVLYTRTSISKMFRVEKNVSLSQMFDEAYKLLGEQKQPNDSYFCRTGTSLSSSLTNTVESVVKSECRDASFEIRGPTGGA